MKRILSVLCLSLLSTSAAWAILNGASDTSHPGVGQIPATAGHPACTATLISRNAVLTTASCFLNSSSNPAFSFSPQVGSQANLVATYSNPQFNGGAVEAFDVAVAILDKSKNRGWRFKPYALNASPLAIGTVGAAVGFGATGANGTGTGSRNFGALRFSGYLSDFDATQAVIPNAYEQVDPGTSTYQMICPGDTGGPLLVNGAIAGLAAFPQGAPCSSGPGFGLGSGYEMTVDRLAPWITATLNQYDPPGACNYNDDTAFVTFQGGCQDAATKLVWGKIDAGATQAGAAAECAAETEAGVTGWRLPTGTEYSILASDDPAHHVIRPSDDGSAWTSDIRGSLGGVYNFGEYSVYFGNPGYLHRVLCVRAGS